MGGHKTISASNYHIPEDSMFYDRGDPISYDLTLSDFITDGLWHDLDLSGIIPPGTQAALANVIIRSPIAASNMSFRKNGHSNIWAISAIDNGIAGVMHWDNLVIVPDTNRIAEYVLANVAWNNIYFTIVGWWK